MSAKYSSIPEDFSMNPCLLPVIDENYVDIQVRCSSTIYGKHASKGRIPALRNRVKGKGKIMPLPPGDA